MIRRRVERAAPGTFFKAQQFEGCARHTVDTTLAKLVRERSDFRRVWRGLYWKGVSSRFGAGSPDALAAAMTHVGKGSGPAGISAANALGLSTQIAARPVVAVVGSAPTGVKAVRFSRRSNLQRLQLKPLEIALLEVLRDFPRGVEASWQELVERVDELSSAKSIRLHKVEEAVRQDGKVAARKAMRRLRSARTPELAGTSS